MMYVLVAAALIAQETPRGGKVEWRRDIDAALAEARKAGKPVVMYFTADW